MVISQLDDSITSGAGHHEPLSSVHHSFGLRGSPYAIRTGRRPATRSGLSRHRSEGRVPVSTVNGRSRERMLLSRPGPATRAHRRARRPRQPTIESSRPSAVIS